MGKFLRHTSCGECQSSDANALYDEGKNVTSSHCFSCGFSKANIDKKPREWGHKEEEEIVVEQPVYLTVDMIEKLPSAGVRERGIVKNLSSYYGMKIAKRGDSDEITHHYYPFTLDGKIIGYQERDVANKDFKAIGRGSGKMDLQGQHLWPNGGGKYLTIVEGFLDMLAASQMMDGKLADNRYPIVSLPAGASNLNAVKHNLDWINSFERVHLMLDQDDAGDKAARNIAKYCKPGIIFISKFSEKDPCDMLINGKYAEFKEAFWNATKFSPADIVSALDARNILSLDNEVPSMPYPAFASALNISWYGKRKGELTLFTAGTGSGKSQFLKEDMYNLLTEYEDIKIGVVSLEESTRDILMGMQAIKLNKRIHLPDVLVTDEEKESSIKWLEKDIGERLVMLDHQGSSADDDLLSKIRYLIAIDCEYIYIDHITIAVSEANDTNKAIDSFMSELLKLCKRHSVWFGVVSHLRKTSGDRKSFENGAIPTDDDLKGSGSIKQIAFDIIALCRNKMAKDPTVRNTTKLYVLKSRYTGRTGFAGKFLYDNDTGRLIESSDKEEDGDDAETFIV
jgi:twinkle protein